MAGDLLERVDRGAALLDEYDPDWWEVIDLDRLDISSWRSCVLGQLAEANVDQLATYSTLADDLLWSNDLRSGDFGMDGRRADTDAMTPIWFQAVLWREHLSDRGEL
jgi:hypothetical protein